MGSWFRRTLLFSLMALAFAALWQWFVRQLRQPAPAPDGLLHTLPDALIIQRKDDVLRIQWEQSYANTQVFLARADQSFPHKASAITDGNSVTLTIDPAQRYRVAVRFPDGHELSAYERTIPLASVPNFRDIGGYTTTSGQSVRWNRVYRASALDRLSADDQANLTRMRLKLVCDVRTSDESRENPDILPSGIELLNAPPHSDDNRWLALGKLLFVPGHLEDLLRDLYMRVMLDENPQVFRAIFRRLAQADSYPMVIHCAAGKDRTGIVVALLLRVLGVPDKTIIADYTLSNHHYDFFAGASRKVMAQLSLFGIGDDDFGYLLIADGDVMRDTLAHINRVYGSAEAYLTQYAGLTDAELNAIRQQLLE